MAKIRPTFRSKSGSTKRIQAVVIIHRTASRKAAFEACVRLGYRKPRGGTQECAYGKNPRKATAAAMREVAKALSRRSGAFAGYRK